MIGLFTLMHNEDKVCDIRFNGSGYIESVGDMYDERLLPPSVRTDTNLTYSLMDWISDRVGINERPDIMGVRTFLSPKAFQFAGSVSLFDCYWFRNNTKDTWEKVNPYDNWKSSKDIVCLLNIKPENIKKDQEPVTPNFSIPGKSTDFWYKYKDKIYYLSKDIEHGLQIYKKNMNSSIIEPRLYTVIEENLFTAKLSQTDKDTESITLSSIYKAYEDKEKNKAENLINVCEKVGINKRETVSFVEKLIEADENAGVEDRELNTIFLLRDSHTLEMKGFAKI